jgi:CRISPR/Cas system-associated exonuclease Cas4 (RecB family)
MNFTWSFSALKEYVNCPKQYQELKVLKRYEKKATEQMLYGTVVHKACEDYVAEGKPLEKNYQRFKPVLDSLVAIPGTKYPEHEMALTADKQPCGFRDNDRWVRGIVDLLIVDGDYAFIVDYKTGSNRYPDPKQLKLMALMTFAHFPEVNKIKAGLLFVMHESFMDEEYTRDQIPKLWKYFESDLERLNHSYENDVWQANPTPLCGWCPVKSCEFHKER